MADMTVQELSDILKSYGIPERIKLGGHIFRVGTLHPFVSNGNGGESCILGICDVIHNEIGIVDDIDAARAWSTLQHEVIEALCDMYQLNIKHQSIQTLETGLFDFMISNPRMLQNILSFALSSQNDMTASLEKGVVQKKKKSKTDAEAIT